jgi:hypothetical protein
MGKDGRYAGLISTLKQIYQILFLEEPFLKNGFLKLFPKTFAKSLGKRVSPDRRTSLITIIREESLQSG